jgi:hypothetical protein
MMLRRFLEADRARCAYIVLLTSSHSSLLASVSPHTPSTSAVRNLEGRTLEFAHALLSKNGKNVDGQFFEGNMDAQTSSPADC